MVWPWVGHGLCLSRPCVGHGSSGVDHGWSWFGHGLVMAWSWLGHGFGHGFGFGHGLVMALVMVWSCGGHGLVMGWSWVGPGVVMRARFDMSSWAGHRFRDCHFQAEERRRRPRTVPRHASKQCRRPVPSLTLPRARGPSPPSAPAAGRPRQRKAS